MSLAPRLLSGALSLLIAATAFWATTRGIRILSRSPTDSLVVAKLLEFELARNEWDVVFIGNSHVYRHVDPVRFDAALERAGHPMRSYNLGAPKMNFPELHYVLRRIQRLQPERLLWVFIDLTFPWQIDPRNFASRRVVAWHDLTALAPALDLALFSTSEERLGPAGALQHLTSFADRLTNSGRGVELVARLFGDESTARRLAGHRRGFQGLNVAHSERQANRVEGFLQQVSTYREEVARLRRTAPLRIELDPHRARWLTSAIEGLTADGIQVVLYMPPIISNEVHLPRDTVDRRFVHFAFNDPQRYPELYAPENRFDRGHLNEAGAVIFSELLASLLAARLDSSHAD